MRLGSDDKTILLDEYDVRRATAVECASRGLVRLEHLEKLPRFGVKRGGP